MTGLEHYAEAESLLAFADRYTRAATYDQEWTLTFKYQDPDPRMSPWRRCLKR